MIISKTASTMLLFGCFLLWQELTFGGEQSTPEERQEYDQDYNRVVSMTASLSQDNERDLKAYEKLADDVDKKWREKNRAVHARLMLEICKPLSSGTFNESRRFELASKYALSALEKPDEIPLVMELKLAGQVTTARTGSDFSKGEEFAKLRKQDVAIRLHAWKRLISAADPKWNPEEIIWGGNVPPPEGAVGLPPGVEPRDIKDTKLRKEYEEAIQLNRQKSEKHKEQSDLRNWLKTFPKYSEKYIIQVYSRQPLDINELKKMLDDSLPDQDAKTRIIDAVTKNIRETKKE